MGKTFEQFVSEQGNAPTNLLFEAGQMKLTSLRPKDLIHLEILDDLGLVAAAIEERLPSVLQDRLKEARKQIAASKPDIEG